jgi:polysaccharide pyruvyl transferase CsaB
MSARIGIIGSYGGLNVGDEAILASMLSALRSRLPDARFSVFSRAAEHTRAHHDVDDVVPARDVTRDEAAAKLRGVDLVLLGGGGILYDSEARVYLRLIRLAQSLEIPTMAYAVGAGPLSFDEDRRMVRSTLPRMAAVTVRDRGSQRILESCELRCPIEVTADPALLLDASPAAGVELTSSGVPPGRRVVGMSLREPGHAAPDLDDGGYQSVLAHAADFACTRFDAEVVFIPMEACDLRLSHAVIGRMVRADHAHVLKAGHDPGRLLGLMAQLDMVVAMRLHVLIFSAVAGTPALALPYAPKVADFASALGLRTAPPATSECVGALLAALDAAWDLRRADRRRVPAAVDMLRARSRRTADIAVQCLADAPAAHQPVAG